MKKYLLTLGMAALLAGGLPINANPLLNADPQLEKSIKLKFSDYVQNMAARTKHSENVWRKAENNAASFDTRRKIVTSTDGQIGPVSMWGSLYTPSGEEWLYSATYTYENITPWSQTITAAEFTVYDAEYKVQGSFTTEFQLAEHETSINMAEIAPTLSKKFFDINDAYEVMLYVHATTDDYTGHSYTQIFTLKDGSKVTEIEGNNIAAVNTAKDPWSENFNMVFMREGYSEETGLLLYFDVYSKAGWTGGCQLQHTFELDYQNIAGAGNAALPFLINSCNNQLYFATAAYEKPYFVSSTSEDITPDNHLILKLYDSQYQQIKETWIPIELEEGAIFSFPGVGELYGYQDLDFTVFGTPESPVYIVGVENYQSSTDDFITNMYVYDTDGNRLKTIFVDAADYKNMSPVDGYPEQFCVLHQTESGNVSDYDMIDIPSCEVRTTIPSVLEGIAVSTSFDRVPSENGYSIVATLLGADADDDGNALHTIYWFDPDGNPTKVHTINLGQDVALAMPYIGSDALSPYLFNTDSKMEYMFLIKRYISAGSSRTEELLRVYNEDGAVLMELGPDPVTGENISRIFLSNLESDTPRLIVSYYANNEYTIRHIDLPLAKFGGGEGTAESPYLIACPGDLMAIYTEPNACYRLSDDLDFAGVPWKGNQCTFTGTLDGDGHTISNLNISGAGIFSEISNTATVRNITFENASMTYSGSYSAGLIAGYVMGDGAKGPLFTDITVQGFKATGSGDDDFGALVGVATLYTAVRNCAVLGCDINLPNANAAGIAGRVQTSTTVEQCLVEGEIKANVAAGIAAVSFKGDENIKDCHVNASITGTEIAGGIIGDSGRSIVTHCFVEGEICAIGTKNAYAGGLVGRLATTYDNKAGDCIYNNISSANVYANAEAADFVAHRIVGFTSNDNWIIDWDNVPSDASSDPSSYPRIPDTKEVHLRDNYAYGVDVVDSKVADAHNTAEGQTIAAITADFLNEQLWLLGEDATAPWILDENHLALYFEDTVHSGIADITVTPTARISYNGVEVTCSGAAIQVYDTAGNLVASGTDCINITHLAKGVYIVVADGASLKFAK